MGELLQFRRPSADGSPTMFCYGCGKERAVPSSADPGPCSCGSTARSSVRPVPGGGVSLQVTAAPGFLFTPDGNDAA
jgi:hypothetical protein